MRTLLRGTVAAIAVLVLSVSAFAQTYYNTIEKPLYAGQSILIGKLVVQQLKENDQKYFVITYDTTSAPAGYDGYVPGWTMQTTHLYVGTEPPKKSAPGRFPFKHEGLDNVTVDTYKIPYSQFFGTQCSGSKKLYIAAHADTCEAGECVPDFASLAASVASANGSTASLNQNTPAAFVELLSSAFGTILAWCVQEDAPLYITNYTTQFLLTYNADGTPNTAAIAWFGTGAQAMGVTAINYLNFLINQPYVINCGSGVPFHFGVIPNVAFDQGGPPTDYGDLVITKDDIQVAIWHITNNAPLNEYAVPGNGSGFYAPAFHVQAIVAHVAANGANFVPGCGDYVLALLDPTYAPRPTLVIQNLGFALPLSGTTGTGDCETAWAKGTTRFCTGWGSYFVYNVK